MEKGKRERKNILAAIFWFLGVMLAMTLLCWKLDFLYTPQIACVLPGMREIGGASYPTVLPEGCLRDDTMGKVVYVPEKTSSPFTPMIVHAVRVQVLTRSGGYAAVSGHLTNDDSVVLYASGPLTDELSVRPEDP